MEPEALEELAESIRSRGILEPLLARELEGGVLEMLAGERRLEAARLAGLVSVPVRVLRDLSDADAREVALVENLARENLTPWEEAHALAALREARKAEGKPVDVRALAGVAGRGKTKAAELLAIADALTPAVLKLAGPLVRSADKLPHEALYGAAKGVTERERADLLARYGAAVAPAKEAANRDKRARAGRKGAKPFTVAGGPESKVSVAIRWPVAELEPEDAADLLDKLRPIVKALEERAGLTDRDTNRQG
jgi:ParB family chromosome partitioning protein